MSSTALEHQTADASARVTLPSQFSNAPVTVRAVSDRAVVVELTDPSEPEVGPDGVPPLRPLTGADRDLLLNFLDNPPEPNEVLKRAAAKYKEWYERNPDPTAE